MVEFGAYIPEEEGGSRERYEAWRVAIGLQAVDGLKTSEYLQATAVRHVEGDISIDDARQIIHGYYESRAKREAVDENEQEADKVSANIAKLLGEQAFSFCPAALWETHRRIFEGVFDHAGQTRKINIRKREWVLDGDSVSYSPLELISGAVDYDFNRELAFDYTAADMETVVKHLADFAAGLWQIHPFEEGNTRTTAVFLIRYLRYMGFEVDNAMFEQHSWYFRNAMVRANYRNRQKCVSADKSFLVLFLKNLLMGACYELKNRCLHIHASDALAIPENAAEAVPAVSEFVGRLLQVMTDAPMSVRALMELLGLRHRPSFMQNYLQPAIQAGLVRRLFEDKENHPRQRYLLTPRAMLARKSPEEMKSE